MEPCHRIRPWVEWLAAGEIGDRKRLQVEAHLRECPDCRRELTAWQTLLGAVADNHAAEAECRTIDWDDVSGSIMRRLDRAAWAVQAAPRRRIFHFAPVAAAASLLLIVTMGIFFWLRQRPEISLGPEDGMISPATVSRLQSGLAREEVISYLQQSQLMFTDLLKNCAREDVASWEVLLYSRQAKELLLQKKYLQQNLPPLEWLRVRDVSERIDWLNYEILQLDDQPLCSRIGRLQQIMEKEKLLLKIRLLEKDLTQQPYREV